MELKKIEKQVRAERKAEEERAVAEEVRQRLEAVEAARLLQEMQEEAERERMLRPLPQQEICGVSSTRVLKMVPETFPIACIAVPEQIVLILEQIFDVEDDRTRLSNMTTTLLECLHRAEGTDWKEAMQRGQHYLAERRAGPTVEVPILTMQPARFTLRDIERIARLEEWLPLICGWALGYLQRKEEQELLMQILAQN